MQCSLINKLILSDKMETPLITPRSENYLGTPQPNIPDSVSDMMDHAIPSPPGRLSPDRPKSAHAHSACRKKYMENLAKAAQSETKQEKGSNQTLKMKKEVKETKKQELLRTNQKHLAKDPMVFQGLDIVSDTTVPKVNKNINVKNQKFSKNTVSHLTSQVHKQLNSPRSISEYSSGFQISYKPLPVHLNNFYPSVEKNSREDGKSEKTNAKNINSNSDWDKKFRNIRIGSRIPVASYRTTKLKDGSLVLNTPRGDIKVIYPDDEEAYYKDLDPVEYFDDKSVWDLPLPSPAKTQKFTSGMARISDVGEDENIDTESPNLEHPKLKQRPWSELPPEQEKLANRKKFVNTNNNVYAMFFDSKLGSDSNGKASKVQHNVGFKGKTLKQNKQGSVLAPLPVSKSPDPQMGENLDTISEELTVFTEKPKKAEIQTETRLALNTKQDRHNKWTTPKGEKQHVGLDKKFIQNSLSVKSYKPSEKKMNQRPFSDFTTTEADAYKMRINGYQNVQLDDAITKYENMEHFKKAKPKFQRAPYRNAPQSEIGTPRGLLMESHGIHNKQHIMQPRRLRPIKN